MADGADRTGRRPRKGVRSAEASLPLAVAVIDREGMVLAIVAGRAPARAFLREGRL